MLEVLQYEFMQNALLAGLLAAVACGIVGVYVVVKKVVFISGGIAHASFGGIGLGYLLGINPVLGAMFFTITSALGIGLVTRRTRLPEDTAIGILWAMGHSRRWLVLRTVGEMIAVVAVAWLLGAAICLVGLLAMQIGLFAPKGMALDFASPAPWVSTVPLPLAIIAVSAGLVVWMLSRLDPVSIIERRS